MEIATKNLMGNFRVSSPFFQPQRPSPAGNDLAAGFRSADPQKLRDLLGDDFPICNVAASNHHLEKGRKLSTILWKKRPLTVTLVNEGLGWDPLLKM